MQILVAGATHHTGLLLVGKDEDDIWSFILTLFLCPQFICSHINFLSHHFNFTLAPSIECTPVEQPAYPAALVRAR